MQSFACARISMIHRRHGCVCAHLYDSAFWSSRDALAEAEDDERYIHALCFLMRIFEFVVLFIFSAYDRRHGCVRAHLQDSPTTWLRLLRINQNQSGPIRTDRNQ